MRTARTSKQLGNGALKKAKPATVAPRGHLALVGGGGAPPRRPSETTNQVIAMLHGMGYRKSVSRWLVWTALRGNELPRDRPATKAELLRAALRAGSQGRRAVRQR